MSSLMATRPKVEMVVWQEEPIVVVQDRLILAGLQVLQDPMETLEALEDLVLVVVLVVRPLSMVVEPMAEAEQVDMVPEQELRGSRTFKRQVHHQAAQAECSVEAQIHSTEAQALVQDPVVEAEGSGEHCSSEQDLQNLQM